MQSCRRFALTVLLGLWGCHFNPALAQERYATIRNCAVTLVGDYADLAGVSVQSKQGLLVQATAEVEGLGTIGLNTPFLINSLAAADPNQIALGAGNSGGRINVIGETTTAILYRGSQDGASEDLSVEIGLSSGEPQPLAFVPGEPDASCAALRPASFSGSNFSGLLGGIGADEQYATIEDGVVVLNGTFNGLGGIEARSQAGRLSQRTVAIDGVGTVALTTPFPSGATPIRTSENVVIGILGADKRIDIEQSVVQTAILYSGSQEEANDDLIINVGLGDNSPSRLTVGGEVGSVDGTFDVNDGFLSLVGSFSRLSGIEATSRDGLLSLDPNVSDPFDADAIKVDGMDGRSVLLGVNTAAGRVDLAGITQTAIRYAGSDASALTDLTVRIGIAGQGAIAISHADATVPEPSAGMLTLWGIAMLGAFRLHRNS